MHLRHIYEARTEFYFLGREKTNKMKKLTITKIMLIQDNRMLRVGVGKCTGEWFLRIDLWWVGYRLTYGI